MIPVTPLTRVNLGGRTVFLKREDRNPYGSHKIHAVANYIARLHATGRLTATEQLHLLVSSSGRFIQALALATADLNIRLHLVSDVLSAPDLLKDLARFHHVVIDEPLINNPDRTGSHLHARLARIAELSRQWSNSLFVDQYADLILAQGYQRTLFPQIVAQAGGVIGGLVIPIGTGGQINGAVRYRRQQGAGWPIFAADAAGSALLRTPPPGLTRKLPGYGNGLRTKLIADVSEEVVPVWVADADAVACCYHLRDQGVWVGPSSGAAAAAFLQVLRESPERLATDQPIVIILPDAGDPYRTTVYDPLWLLKNGLGVPAPQRRVA